MKLNITLLLCMFMLSMVFIINLHAQTEEAELQNNKIEDSNMNEYSIVIDKSRFNMKLYQGSQVINKYQVALGKIPGDKQKVGDKRTPDGDFAIEKIQVASWWEYDFGDGKGPIKAYGPWFIRLETNATQTLSGNTWTGIGIHGTHDEDSIGTLASRGCIRMHNKELVELVDFLKSLPDYHIKVVIRESID